MRARHSRTQGSEARPKPRYDGCAPRLSCLHRYSLSGSAPGQEESIADQCLHAHQSLTATPPLPLCSHQQHCYSHPESYHQQCCHNPCSNACMAALALVSTPCAAQRMHASDTQRLMSAQIPVTPQLPRQGTAAVLTSANVCWQLPHGLHLTHGSPWGPRAEAAQERQMMGFMQGTLP